jgi:hypothetical protein
MMAAVAVVAFALVAGDMLAAWVRDVRQKAEDARWLASPAAYEEDRFWKEFDRHTIAAGRR